MSKTDALDKLSEMCKSNKITLDELVIAEGRINKGIQLPERIERLITE